MVELHVCDQIIGGVGRVTRSVEARTVREAVEIAGIEGQKFVLLGSEPVDDLDRIIPEGLDVTVAPTVGDPLTFLGLLALNVVAAVVSYSLSKKSIGAALASRQEQGDDGSPTYGWNNALSTTYGPGYAIPIVIGRHRIGGNAVDVIVEPLGVVPDVLRLRLQLCEGPIHAIGGLSPPYGELDKLGTLDGTILDYAPIPDGVKLNDVLLDSRGTEVSLRLGYPYQSRLPHWPATATTLPVGSQLEELNQTFTFAVQEPFVDSIVVAINCPSGLYSLSGQQRQSYPLRFLWEVRQSGGAWAFTPYQDITVLRTSAFTSYHRIALPVTRAGPYEVRVTRLTERGDPSSVVSAATWVFLRYEIAQSITLAGRAALEVSVVASERQVDAQPNVSVPVDGLLVRAWDPATGWTGLRWTSAPFTHPIGQNPAWVLTHLLLDDDIGVGPQVKRMLGGTGEEEVWLQKMLNWAVFCDQDDPDDPGQALYRVDLVLDQQAPPLEQVQAILRAGRGAPVHDGGRMWVAYEWLGAHSRGTYSVPARQPQQVITGSSCEAVQIRWLDPQNLPARLQLQYFDEARDWQPDEVPVLDPDRTVTAPGEPAPTIIEETISFLGVTRRHAVRREGWFLLRWNRVSTAEITLRAGLRQISVSAGDLFTFVDEGWYPDPDEPTTSMHTLTDAPTVGVASIVLDRDLELRGAARVGTGLFVMGPDGVAQLCTVDAAGPATIAAGDPVPLWDPAAGGGTGAAASVKCTPGADVATGSYGNFRLTFRVTAVKAVPSWKVQLSAVLWDASIFDAPPEEMLTDWGDSDIGDLPAVPPSPPPIGAPSVPVVGSGDSVTVGLDKITWQTTSERRGDRARVYARRSGTGDYRLVGTSTTGEVSLDTLEVGVDHDVVVLLPTPSGAYASPYEATAARVRLVEGSGPAPAAVPVVTGGSDGGRLDAAWGTVTDADAYEIRRGASWDGARVAQTSDPRLTVDLPEVGDHRLVIRPRSPRGTLGGPVATIVSVVPPLGVIEQLDDLPAAGTHDGTEYDAGAVTVRLSDGQPAGTYVTPELDVATTLDLHWSALIDWTILADDALADLGDLQVGELGLVGAPVVASRQSPGVVAGVDQIGDLVSVTVAELRLPRADRVGHRGDVLVEARWHDGSVWGAWVPYRSQRRLAQKLQVRLSLVRSDLRAHVHVDRLLLTASP